MRLISFYRDPFLLEFPILNKIIILGTTIFSFIILILLISVFILAISSGEIGFQIVTLPIILLACLIINYNLKEGYRIPIQIIELNGKILTVSNKLLFLSFTKSYELSELSIEKIDRWNVLTGNRWPTKYPYGRLKVNNNKTLSHIYKTGPLEELVEQFENEG